MRFEGEVAGEAAMARPGGKHASTKYVVVVSCVGLLAAALIADFLWASSSPSYLSAASSWAVDKADPRVIPRFEKVGSFF